MLELPASTRRLLARLGGNFGQTRAATGTDSGGATHPSRVRLAQTLGSTLVGDGVPSF